MCSEVERFVLNQEEVEALFCLLGCMSVREILLYVDREQCNIICTLANKLE